MNVKFRFQVNTALVKEQMVPKNQLFKQFNVSYLQQKEPLVFPLFWMESGGQIGSDNAKKFKSQVSEINDKTKCF